MLGLKATHGGAEYVGFPARQQRGLARVGAHRGAERFRGRVREMLQRPAGAERFGRVEEPGECRQTRAIRCAGISGFQRGDVLLRGPEEPGVGDSGAARKASNRATSWWSRPAGGESAVNAHFTRPVVRMRRASEGASSRVNAAITGGSSARSETSPTSCEGQSVSAYRNAPGSAGTRREDARRRGGWLVGEGVGDRSWQRADHGAAYRFGFIPEGARPPTHMNPREIRPGLRLVGAAKPFKGIVAARGVAPLPAERRTPDRLEPIETGVRVIARPDLERVQEVVIDAVQRPGSRRRFVAHWRCPCRFAGDQETASLAKRFVKTTGPPSPSSSISSKASMIERGASVPAPGGGRHGTSSIRLSR